MLNSPKHKLKISPGGSDRLSLDQIDITDQLARRIFRRPNYRQENEALRDVAHGLAQSPETILKKLAEKAQTLCEADSTGVSLPDIEQGQEIFRWDAVAGQAAPFLLGTIQKYFSPCSVALDRKTVQLLYQPIRHFEKM